MIIDTQNAIFSALTSSASFMTAVSNNIFDTPQDNQAYPYVCLENMQDTPSNYHDHVGKNIYMTFAIYTQQADTYQAKSIRDIMDSVLNMKNFDLASSNLHMSICKNFSCDDFKSKDILGFNPVYHIIVHNKTKNER